MAGLMPETTYAFESGGEPEHITDLSYEAFTGFHNRYYHPSNSYIVLYGNISSGKTLRFLDENYLRDFSAIAPDSDIAPQPLWTSPRTLSFEAPAPKDDDGTATALLLWLFCDSVDPVSMLGGTVLGHYLLGTESSPLKRALIDSGLGEDLDDMSGFGTEAVQSVFCAGLRKTKPAHAGKIQQIILDTLAEQVEKGMNEELLEGAMRQVEFHLREVDGSHFPYSLRLADRCYNAWLYGGDPLAHLAFEKPLDALKKHRMNGDSFFRDMIKNRLLQNPHRLLSVITASSKMGVELEKQTERQAALLTASFTQKDRERCLRVTEELIKRQGMPPTPESLATLPRLSKDDLPRIEPEIPTAITSVNGLTLYSHPIFTSDIVYLDLCFDLRALPPELVPYLPLYLELLRRCGTKTHTYEQMAVRVALAMGGLGTSVSCKTLTGSADDLFLFSFVRGKSLRSRFNEMLEIMSDLLLNADFSNKKQVKDILLEERNNLNASIISGGHSMALLLASSQLSNSREIEEKLNGITQLRFLDGLIKVNAFDEAVSNFGRLHACIINKNACTISVTYDEPAALKDELSSFVDKLPGFAVSVKATTQQPAGAKGIRGVEISSAVNFMAQSWRLGTFEPEEYGLVFLLTRNLSTGYLWDKVRVEGGAYGGMATMSIAHPIFSCASYRDPNLTATLRHFKNALESVAAGIAPAALEQSIIGAIGRIDQPKSPHGKGFDETMDRLCGYTIEARQRLRDAILNATPEKLQMIARKILATRESATVILGSAAAFDAAEKEGLKFEREPLLK
jgi:Zn-dependent M16 (insulinase) family peptidase